MLTTTTAAAAATTVLWDLMLDISLPRWDTLCANGSKTSRKKFPYIHG